MSLIKKGNGKIRFFCHFSKIKSNKKIKFLMSVSDSVYTILEYKVCFILIDGI